MNLQLSAQRASYAVLKSVVRGGTEKLDWVAARAADRHTLPPAVRAAVATGANGWAQSSVILKPNAVNVRNRARLRELSGESAAYVAVDFCPQPALIQDVLTCKVWMH